MLPWETSIALREGTGPGRWEIMHGRYFKLQAQKLHPVTLGDGTLYFLVLLSDFSHDLVRSAQLDGLFQLFCFLPQLQAQSLIPSSG